MSRIHTLRYRQYIVCGGGVLGLGVLGVLLSVVVSPERTVTLALLGVVGAVVLSVANGGNDIANSMGVVTVSVEIPRLFPSFPSFPSSFFPRLFSLAFFPSSFFPRPFS